MLRLTTYRKGLAASFTLALLFVMVLASYLIIDYNPDNLAQAQGGQPADTVELFKSFWEAWDLLHTNYVDPLNDDALAAGALEGLIAAVPDAPVDMEMPAINPAPADNDERFAPFWETWMLLHERYPDLDDNRLLDGAIYGMMTAVGDPHTDYMDPETYARVNEGMSGEYEGIGASVRQDETTGGLELVTIFEGSPAAEIGLRPGDQIVMVEHEDITDLTQSEIIALVRGPAGSEVQLGILRPGVQEILQYEVKRGRISVPSVSSRILENSIGYVRLSQFEFNTSQQMRDALAELDANNLDGLILDLRGNPGGYLTTSIEVASAYLKEGIVLIERSPDREFEHRVLGNAAAPDVPMAVLVDEGSASASELIAGALQDYDRAVIVGMPTFGKGSVQTWRELSNGGGIRITISRWYTPNGNSVSEIGIQPDINVPYIPEETGGDPDNQLTAAIQVLNGTFDPANQTVQVPAEPLAVQ